MSDGAQFGRAASLIVSKGEQALDLSDVHFRFKTVNQDVESPNNAWIRVYNLSATTARLVREEFDRVTIDAGYADNRAVVFQGDVKQYRVGRENATDTYLDILAADGDLAYNFALLNKTMAAGWTHAQAMREAIGAMAEKGLQGGYINEKGLLGGTVPNPRGKVLFGLPRVILRSSTRATGSTWSVENGRVNIVPLDGYVPGDAVVLNSLTGLVGIPEQTVDGVHAKCLLNPRIVVGGLVQIDNASVNQTINRNPSAPVPYNQWTGLQLLADVSADGLYRVFVAEHEGDTRGPAWHTSLVLLAVNPTTRKVVNPNG